MLQRGVNLWYGAIFTKECHRIFFRPYRGLPFARHIFPTACAVGYLLPLLRS